MAYSLYYTRNPVA